MIKRKGLVYSLYRQNMIHLWIVAGILTAILIGMLVKSHNYLMNYLFYRGEPDLALLTEFTDRDILNIEDVLADIEKNGGESALDRSRTYMFFKENVYQQGSRYRFGLVIDPEKLEDTGVYYDDRYVAYSGITDRTQLKDLIPKENYPTQHLFFYSLGDRTYVLVMDYDLEQDLEEKDVKKVRITFAPMGVYSLYMVKDLAEAGYTEELCNYMIDCRNTPVDFEDEDFKDLVMFLPIALVALIPAILFTVVPTMHPTYHQLAKFARTIQRAADMVDQDYEEHGFTAVQGKTKFIDEWLIKKSFFKNGIEKNYKKQPN